MQGNQIAHMLGLDQYLKSQPTALAFHTLLPNLVRPPPKDRRGLCEKVRRNFSECGMDSTALLECCAVGLGPFTFLYV